MSYIDLRPDKTRQVQVFVDGPWHDAELQAYRQDADGTWRGWVRWTEAIGAQRCAWVREDRIRTPQG